MIRIVLSVAAVVLFAGSVAAQQLSADAVDLSKVKVPETQKSHELCPVTLQPADPGVPTWSHDGVTYGGANAEAQAEFEKDPGRYAAQAAKQRWINNFMTSLSAIWCPVTDEIGPGNMTQWAQLGYTWESCCTFCDQTVRDDMFPRALERLKRRAERAYELTGGVYVEGASSPVEGAIDFTMISDEAMSPEAGDLFAAAAPAEIEPSWLIGKELKPTYTEGVGLIIAERCLECHRPGSVAPIPLLSYQDVRRNSDKLRALITERTMPPWPADPSIGAFANSKRLTKKEMDLLLQWIDDRFPRGDGEFELDERWMSEWTIGEPDHVFELEEYEVPEDAAEHIAEFDLETGFDEDSWIVASEALPSDPFLVRSIVAMPVGEYHAGNSYEFAAPGAGWLLKAGETVTVRIHYTKEEGWEEFDESRLAVRFAEDHGDITRPLHVNRMSNDDFVIPAGEAGVEVTAEFVFPADGHIVSLTPVVRERGKSIRYTAITPDGAETPLLSIPRWDMKWQFRYELAEPMPAPKGTVVRVTAVYDNSIDNAASPDPDVDATASPEGEILEGRIVYTLD